MNRTFPARLLPKGMLVYQRTAGRVDQDSGRFHLLELLLADDVIGIGGVRGVQGTKSAFARSSSLET